MIKQTHSLMKFLVMQTIAETMPIEIISALRPVASRRELPLFTRHDIATWTSAPRLPVIFEPDKIFYDYE